MRFVDEMRVHFRRLAAAWMPLGIALPVIVAALLIGGFSLAAADKPVPPKGAATKQVPAGPVVIRDQGGVTFGEGSALTPAMQQRLRLKWPEMTQKEVDDLTAMLKAVSKARAVPVSIVCKDAMCEDLALNLDNALESARWKSDLVIGTQFGVPGGISASSKWLADMINSATAGRYDVRVHDDKGSDGEKILIGARPR